MSIIRYYRSAERPTLDLWLTDRAKNLIDFSTGYTFSLKIGEAGSAALLTKTSGITGAAGAGTGPSGTPNIVIAFTAGEVASVPTTRGYTWQLTATSGGLDRVFQGSIRFVDVIT